MNAKNDQDFFDKVSALKMPRYIGGTTQEERDEKQ